jgi:cytochrome P450
MIELALRPASQRALQDELHSIFNDAPSESWDYESSINVLMGGMCGGVLNEQLRLMPPVIGIPKQVSDASDAAITIKGSKYMLPAGAKLSLAPSAAHRNPRYWPTQPSIRTDLDNDLDDFRPERWLIRSTDDHDSGSANSSNDEFAGPTCDSSQTRLFRPVRGSYLPFSDGARACIGKRLAQVEMMAILAVIFQNCSVELAVDQWASDEEVSQMSKEEKIAVYEKAKENARAIMKTATARITLKLHSPGPTFIPVRVVRKGSERFIHLLQ